MVLVTAVPLASTLLCPLPKTSAASVVCAGTVPAALWKRCTLRCHYHRSLTGASGGSRRPLESQCSGRSRISTRLQKPSLARCQKNRARCSLFVHVADRRYPLSEVPITGTLLMGTNFVDYNRPECVGSMQKPNMLPFAPQRT